MPDLEQIRSRLRAAGQEHLLHFHDELDAMRRERLLTRLTGLQIERLPDLVERFVRNKPTFEPPANLSPAPYYPADPDSPKRSWDRATYRQAGERLVRNGKVAVLTVAGGQGTRLGFDGPKGCFPIGPVTDKPLFQVLAEQILAARRRYDAPVHWCVMTSPHNRDQTERFFRERDWFGLGRQGVTFFDQGVMPSLEMRSGRVLLADTDEPATNPDGHGGSLKALHQSGALEQLRTQGVEHISYVQVDNPLVQAIDPVFLGLHVSAPDSSAEMSSKMVAKTEPSEKVGVFCLADGRLRVIEYSDLPDELSQQRDERGELRFNAGSPAIHAISLDFIARLNEGAEGFALPLHRAEKKVAHIDLETGRRIEPDEPNAVKLESFVFDAIPLCDKPLILETLREEEFAPVKNAQGKDSPQTSRLAQIRRAARWLEQAGAAIPRRDDGEPDCVLEISPLTASEPADLRNKSIPKSIEPGERLAL